MKVESKEVTITVTKEEVEAMHLVEEMFANDAFADFTYGQLCELFLETDFEKPYTTYDEAPPTTYIIREERDRR